MGEYVNFRNDQFKLGTCENMYYTTYQLYLDALKRGIVSIDSISPTEPDVYIGGGFRFRFPFPDESFKFGEYPDDHESSYLLWVPCQIDIFNHDFVKIPVENIKGQYHSAKLSDKLKFAYRLPCPNQYSTDNKLRGLVTDNKLFEQWQAVYVKQQKPVLLECGEKYQIWAVLECPYCGNLVRVSYDEIKQISDFAQLPATKKRGVYSESDRKIIARMLYGYKRQNDELQLSALKKHNR